MAFTPTEAPSQRQTLEAKHEARQEKLKQLQKQVKEVTKREIKRLQVELEWLKRMSVTGIDEANQERKEIDEVLVLNEIDELLGGGS